jgi:membrane protease YdiL (CAAX protease family)
VTNASVPSKRQDALGIALFVSLTFGFSWSLVPFFGQAWTFGASIPSRLLGVVLPYVIVMGWQPLAAVLIIRAWAETDPLDAGLRRTGRRYLVLGIVGALISVGVASLVKWLLGSATRPWFAPLASALSEPSLDGPLTTVCLVAALLLVWAQAIGEEIGFRGYLLQRTVQLCGPWRGLALQAFLWGAWYAPVILLSRANASGGVVASATFVVTCLLLGAVLGCLRIVAASITPSSAANSLLTLGAGLPFLLHDIDVGLPTAIYEPCGWLPMLLILIGLRFAGISLALGDRRFRRT